MVARVVPGTLRREATSAVTTHSFLVAPLGAARNILAPPQIYTIAYKHQQDVVDGVYFFPDTALGAAKIICSRAAWPVLTARDQLGAPHHPAAVDGMLIGLPGAFVTRSLNDTFRTIANARIGVSPLETPTILGGASVVLPNSPEVAFPRAAEITPLPEGRHAIVGRQFAGSRETFALPAQEIVNRTLSPHNPDIFCMRLLERTIRLTEQLREPLTVPEHLSLKNGKVYGLEEISRDLPILGADALRSVLKGESALPQIVAALKLEATETPTTPFLKEHKLPVTTESETGERLDSFEADLVARDGVDCVASIGWCLIQNEAGHPEPYLVANIGARVALAARFRENHDHPIAFATSERHAEIVTGAIGSARTLTELEERAVSALEQETGLSIRPDTQQTVMQGFRSPGFSPDGDHVYLMEVDPTCLQSKKKTNTVNFTFLIKACDVRELAWEGGCSDLLLQLSAGIVEHGYSSLVPQRGAALLTRTGMMLAALSGESSEGFDIIKDHLPGLLATPALRRQVRSMFEREGQDASSVGHPSEATFFSPLLAESPKPKDGHGTINDRPGFGLLMDHDHRHYRIGEFIPYFTDANGRIAIGAGGAPVMHSMATNREMLMTNEAYALYGDAQTARRMGIGLYENLSGEPSPARIFDAIAVSTFSFDPEQELAALYTMVVKGEIPRFILEHPDYEQWRQVIRSKLIGYFVRDRPNSDLMYDYWKEHPVVAQVALDFCPQASTNLSIFKSRFEELMRDEAEASEGFNPFKARLERLWRAEIPRIALNLGLLKSYAIKNNSAGVENYLGSIDVLLEQLKLASLRLGKTLEGIANMEPSRENIAAAELYLSIAEELLPKVSEQYGALAADTHALTAEQIGERRDKRYFLTKIPEFHTSGDMERLIEVVEFANFDREGLARPPSMLPLPRD